MFLLLLPLVVGIAHVTWSAEICSVSGDDYCRCSTSNGLTLDLRHIGLSYPYVSVHMSLVLAMSMALAIWLVLHI